MTDRAQEVVEVVRILGPLLAAAIFAAMWWLERTERISSNDNLRNLLMRVKNESEGQ